MVDDNPLTAGATTLTATELADLPAVAAPDYYIITLDPVADGNGPELVYVTAHTGSATTATISRGEEGTTGVEHALGVDMLIGVATPLDLKSNRVQYAIDMVKAADDTPDDNFNGASLDGKWTVVSGATKTPDYWENNPTVHSGYNVNDRLEFSLFDDPAEVLLRQDFTLGDGDCLVVKWTLGGFIDSTSGVGAVNNGYWQLGVGDNDVWASTTEGTSLLFFWDTSITDEHIRRYDGAAFAGTNAGDSEGQPFFGGALYMRVIREGLVYKWFSSYDGRVWSPYAPYTATGALTDVWLRTHCATTAGQRPTISTCEWIRQGSGTAVNPW